jgi:diguanylate cyclase
MELEQWKQKYYDQLDNLEKKEQDWEDLQTTLKRAIGRLSLAAEGQHSSLDRHLNDLRSAMKNNINQQQIESIVDDISRILAKLEEGQGEAKRKSIDILEQLLSKLTLPKKSEKSRHKLLKKLAKSDDTDSDNLLKQSLELLLPVIKSDISDNENPGLIDRIFKTGKNDDLSSPKKIPSSTVNTEEQYLNTYKTCLIDLLNKLDNPDSPNGKLAALKICAQDAQKLNNLDKLSEQLSQLLQTHTRSNSNTDNNIENILSSTNSESSSNSQPSIQELLIRLLEQLIIPGELQSKANKIKLHLEQETTTTNWKPLLKDVALLINSIRSHLQKEKQEFEEFLQQLTDRLKTLDRFLQNESSNLHLAESDGLAFDKQLGLNVKEIRNDINHATELTSLKENVTSKLDTISEHIKHYRDSENVRFQHSQSEIDAMQLKMQALESETSKLKKLVIEKNRQAMFDALTEIPNRLSYENKADEEIARWKRFSNPLSLVIWDIDLFKKVNDTYGHKAGDKVLKTVAQLLVKSIRETDFLARYGGEEFVMLLPGTKQEETLRLVNKLRQQVENCGFHYHGESVKITISCGVSSFNENDTLNQVFERADKALYRAKENGRNQCVVASCLSN